MSTEALRPITALTDIYGLRVFVRTGMDVPVEAGKVPEHYRIERALPTLKYLIERGARVVVINHIGRSVEASNRPLVKALEEHIPISFIDDVVGERAFNAIVHMKEGTALMLENVRSCEGEKENDLEFAKKLAENGDFYVNDAFSVSHREHASIVTLPTLLPSFAGITFLEEYEALTKAFTPDDPSLFILGGAKFDTKIPLVEKYVDIYTRTFIGGALANDFIKAKGYEVGKSLLSSADLSTSLLLERDNLLIPMDVIASVDSVWRETKADMVMAHEQILDVGPQSISMLEPLIKSAKTILWNGPLGNYEEGYGEATERCARLVAESDGYSIVGGGDTVAAIESLKLEDSFDFISTAGGAMLEFLEKKTLPGIEALCKI